jgi:hypothetical protein
MDNITPHYINTNNEPYCQYCIEGIPTRTPDKYLLDDMPRGSCVNCNGEHTPAEKDYYIVEACTIKHRAATKAAHAAEHGYLSATGERLVVIHDNAGTIGVHDSDFNCLDFFTLPVWRVILAEGLRRANGLVINW